MNEIYFIIEPSATGTFVAELNECLIKSVKAGKGAGGESLSVVKQTVFIKSSNKTDFYAKKQRAISILNDFYKSALPPTSFIGQIPGSGRTVAMEVVAADLDNNDIAVSHKSVSGVSYSVVSHPSFKEVFAAGLTVESDVDESYAQTKGAFELMRKILKKEGMDFSHIVRQWNYIEKLLAVHKKNGFERQNYQIFNDVRSDYYRDSDFENGYPAATGIGMNEGGVVLEFIAVKQKKGLLTVIPISNPVQVNAHEYTKEVLVGSHLNSGGELSSPKFERAKCVMTKNRTQFYISGTAAVRRQSVVGDADIEAQTLTTIENLKTLLSRKNLSDHGIRIQVDLSDISFLRVYIKNTEDILKAKTICKKYFKKEAILFLIADICRDHLLIEMEGYMSVKK